MLTPEMQNSTVSLGGGVPLGRSAIHEAAYAFLPNAVSSRSSLPPDQAFVVARGKGATLYAESGDAYVDYHAGAGALILGHAHSSVVDAVSTQMSNGAVFFGSVAAPTVRLAEALVNAVPCAEKVIFTTTGSEATAYAIRLARAFTARRMFLKFEGAYHGNHDAALSQLAPGDCRENEIGVPECSGVPEAVAGLAVVAQYNDLASASAVMARYGQQIAAIIVEPVHRHIFATPEFLKGLRELADSAGALLIFDEVVTGFRLAYGGAQEYFGVIPHLACYGKIIGGGLPLGAVAGPASIIDQCSGAIAGNAGYVLVNGTHHGNPLAAAAGLASLRELRKPGFYANLNSWTSDLRAGLQAVLTRHHVPARVVGNASMWQLTFLPRDPTSHRDLQKDDHQRIRRFDREMVNAGVYLLSGNRRLATVAHGDAEAERTIAALDAACRYVD